VIYNISYNTSSCIWNSFKTLLTVVNFLDGHFQYIDCMEIKHEV